jgi:hypothetical protein
MAFSAFLDTCVLVPSVLRDLLLELGTNPAYRLLQGAGSGFVADVRDEFKNINSP